MMTHHGNDNWRQVKLPSALDFAIAEAVVEHPSVIGQYAACEWDELGDDGKVWVAAIVRRARSGDDVPSPSSLWSWEMLAVFAAAGCLGWVAPAIVNLLRGVLS